MFFSVKLQLFLFLLALLGFDLPDPAQCLTFNFPNFTDASRDEIFVSPEANIAFHAIQVTAEARGASIANLAGRTLFKRRYRLWKDGGKIASFNTSFVLNIKKETIHGGEGLAFILTADQAVPPNSYGQWLGIVNQETNGSLQTQIVAIEFDTRKSYEQDLDDNHVGLDVNSVYSRRQVSLTGLGVELSAAEDIEVRVRYDGESKNLSLFVKEMENPVFVENIDLSVYLPKKIFVGFSASTSNETQLNCVKSWEFNGTDIDKNELTWVWIVVPVVGVVLLVGVGTLVYWRRKLEREKMEDAYPSIEEAIQGSSNAPRKFKLKELRRATGNFSPRNKLGKGGFGTVYKGVIGNKEIAVKKFSEKSTQGKSEFIAEVTTIGNLHHRNLVKLIGWCYEKRQFLLVYEYLPNGSLDKFIFVNDQKPSEIQESTMGWVTRRSIVLGAAQALDYLHNGCEDTVLHRDIKSSNIMLDSEFCAKLGDFGLARTMKLSDQTHHSTKEIAGTPGYMAPESILTGRFTVETDVYAFGVLILEVGCGRKPGSQNHHSDSSGSIVNWVWELHRKGSILSAADSKLNGDFEAIDMECFLILGLACCHPNPNKRPSMKTALQVLKGEAAAPPVPSDRPAFMWPPLPPSFKELEISLGQITPISTLSAR